MKKILVTRKLLKECEYKAQKTFDAKLNSNDELYSQTKLIELSNGCDAVLTSLETGPPGRFQRRGAARVAIFWF